MSTENTTTTTTTGGGVVARHVVDTVCDMAGLERDAVYTEDSGRGMYGRTCFGVTVAPGEVAAFRAAMSTVHPHIGLSWADAAIDSLGSDVIVYFPHWRLADETAPAGAEPTDAGTPHNPTGRSPARCGCPPGCGCAAGREEEWAVWSDEATADPNDEAALLRVRADRADAMEWAATYGRRRRVARRVITRSRWIPVALDRVPFPEDPTPGGNPPGPNRSATRPSDSRTPPVGPHDAALPRTPVDRDSAGTDDSAHAHRDHLRRRVAREVIAAVCAAAETTPVRLATNCPGPGEPWFGVVMHRDAVPRLFEALGSVRPRMLADARLRTDGEDVLVFFPGWVLAEPVNGVLEGEWTRLSVSVSA